jgi:hypothetical protein
MSTEVAGLKERMRIDLPPDPYDSGSIATMRHRLRPMERCCEFELLFHNRS